MNNVDKLNNDYNIIKNLRNEIVSNYNVLSNKITVIDHMYQDFVRVHRSKDDTFGSDSFYFQNKQIKNEFDFLRQSMKSIETRMYCEYYQIHYMIQEFVLNDIPSETLKNKILIKKKYKCYKKLNTSTEYDFETITEMRTNIMNAILELNNYQIVLDNELTDEIEKSKLGINIENLVNSTRFSHLVVKERIALFVNFLTVFNIQHKKYFNRLLMRTKIAIGMINEDIKLKETENEMVTDDIHNQHESVHENENITFFIKETS